MKFPAVMTGRPIWRPSWRTLVVTVPLSLLLWSGVAYTAYLLIWR